MNNKSVKSFGLRVRGLREDRNWSQEDLAAEIGSRRQYISAIELGKTNPKYDLIERIANAFGLSLAELFQGVS